MLIAALFAWAFGEQPKPAPIPAGDATISGRVTERDSGAPIAQAFVTLAAFDLKATLVTETDVAGRYTFEKIARAITASQRSIKTTPPVCSKPLRER